MQCRIFHLSDYLDDEEAFHFARKSLDARRPRYQHSHDYYEVFFVEHGCTRHFVNDRTELLQRGDIVFMRPDDRHALQSIGDEPCIINNVMFRCDTAAHLGSRYAGEFAGRFFWHDGAYPDRHVIRGPRMERAINTALELQGSLRTLARIEEFLLTLMTRVIDYDGALPQSAPQWLSTACMAARSREVFRKGAAGFVEVAGRGHEHVCRETRRHLGLSPSELVNRIRMENAAMQLGNSALSVEEVAYDCGIENMSHFYKLFRNHYGTTPRGYRKRHLSDPVQPG
ncbi:MAG: helix-turn-helix domain-containing protein [Rhizobiaceae bacterium]|nr:AraC family transcriptional regulator [Hyphomicrobiales bacterium]NRB32160.1 helix-turn-helix domain-containing protein [Rhizobiaceae bacterium]